MSAILFAACLVIGVPDGDSIRVKCPQRVAAFPVRIAGIDAPEGKNRGFGWDEQPGYRESRGALTELCLGKLADVRRIGFDRDRRAIATVKCAGLDAGGRQAMTGMAWANEPYPLAGSPIPALAARARELRIGLWDGLPVAPWVWRKKSTGC